MDTKKLIGTIIGVTLFAILIAGATFAWLTFGTTLGENVYNGQTMNFIVRYTSGTDIAYLPILDSDLAIPGTSSTNSGVGISETELDANETSGLVVVMRKNTNSTDGHAAVYLTTTSDTKLTADGVVRWAICRDTDVEDGTQVDDTCGADGNFDKALNAGKITGPGTIMLLNDARLADDLQSKTLTTLESSIITSGDDAGKYGITCTPDTTTATGCTSVIDGTTTGGTSNTQSMIEESGVSYFVYFWFDGETIQNYHLYDANKNGVIDSTETEVLDPLYSGYIHASANQLQN